MNRGFWLSLLCGLATVGCIRSPARTSGPSETEGIELKIVGQSCDDFDEPDWEGLEAVELRMRVSVANRGPRNVGFDPDRLRLIAPDQVTPSPVAADAAMLVAPGETKVAGVRFMNRGSLKCKEEMKLDPSDSLVVGARPLQLRPIAFVARNPS
jgi:hypothetical protein